MSSVNMCIRIDSYLKAQVEEVLSELGMNMSGTINMFLKQIAREKAVPLNLSLSRSRQEVADDLRFAQTERLEGKTGYEARSVLTEVDQIIAAAEKRAPDCLD